MESEKGEERDLLSHSISTPIPINIYLLRAVHMLGHYRAERRFEHGFDLSEAGEHVQGSGVVRYGGGGEDF